MLARLRGETLSVRLPLIRLDTRWLGCVALSTWAALCLPRSALRGRGAMPIAG
jgi:hypothetical protein